MSCIQTSYLRTIKNSCPQLFNAQRRELFTQICKAVTFTYLKLCKLFSYFDVERRKLHLVWINQRKVYNISFTNLNSFSLWPTFPSRMLLARPAVPQTQKTRKVCVSTLLPNQYAQILLIYCKSSNHAHQPWYQAQTILI